MTKDKNPTPTKKLIYQIARYSGYFSGHLASSFADHSKRTATQISKVKKLVTDTLTKGLIFYCFINLSLYVLRLGSPGRALPSAEKIRRRFKNVLPEEIADKLTEAIISQKSLSESPSSVDFSVDLDEVDRLQAEQMRKICALIRRMFSLERKRELLELLIAFFQIDGAIENTELSALRQLSKSLGLTAKDFDDLFSTIAPRTTVIDKASFYEILEIDSSASAEQIHKAYRRMAAKYHPDRVANETTEAQQKAHNRFIEINQAFRRLKI